MSDAKYAIGIDLGTTHCAFSYIDLAASEGEQAVQHMLLIPQLTEPGTVEELALLPSFFYLPHQEEMAASDLVLPWATCSDRIIGELARKRGALTPIRLVASAKSWLCHPGVDRRGSILPLDAPPEVEKVSPFRVTIGYLEHLRDAWNHRFPETPLEAQDITVTIPASFDPAARDLTAEAAQAAGYRQLTLLEEPQAALYSWLQRSEGEWRKQVQVGDIIVVIDIGGGTTDFSLIAVIEREGNLELYRVAVGDHILLGGDNMDLALAHVVNNKLANEGKSLDRWQLTALTHGCRQAKEQLLRNHQQTSAAIVVPSRGSRLIGGSIRTELTREEVIQTLLEGFFPEVESDAKPGTQARVGLTQLGLPYAQDAAITRHLAAFLTRQRNATIDLQDYHISVPEGRRFLHPTAVLFNGGVLKSPIISERILNILNGWLAKDEAPAARLLSGVDMDLAVARGAAYFSYAKQRGGVRIRGGTAQAYYVGVASSMPAVPGVTPPVQALCVAPFGMEEGTVAEQPPQEFGLIVGEPVRFRFFGSSVRRHDQVGELLEQWSEEELQELGEIEVTLPAEGHTVGEIVPVRLRASVTETATLALAAALPNDDSTCWEIEFEVHGIQS